MKKSKDINKSRLLVLGVTGGIGSGKTTVCRHLEAMGASVFYADLEAKRLMMEDRELTESIRHHFGEESYDSSGRLNRSYLAGMVFRDKEKLALLNSLVHPRVRNALHDFREQARQQNKGLLVYEAALLLESGGRSVVDAVAVIHAPERVRVQRVVERDSTNHAQVLARVRNQLPSDDMIRQADFVIENDGTIEQLELKTARLKNRFEELGGPPAITPEWIDLNESPPEKDDLDPNLF